MKKEIIEWENQTYSLTELLQYLKIPKSTFFRYKKMGCTNMEAIDKCILNKRDTYFFHGKKCTLASIADQFGFKYESIYRHLKRGKTLEEAVSSILKNKQMTYDPTKQEMVEITYYSYQGKKLTLQEIAKLENVASSNLYHHVVVEQEPLIEALSSIKKNQQQRIHSSRIVDNEDRYFKIGDISLSQYCQNHGYNYDVIVKKVLLQKITPEEAVEQYLEKGQQTQQKWKHQYGKVVLKHLLTKYHFNSSYAISLLKQQNCTLEELVPKIVFSKQSSLYNKNEGLYLLSIYSGIEKVSFEERGAYLEQLCLTSRQQQILETKHQEISFIRRELLYYELDSIFSTCSKEEKASLIEQHHLSQEELDYMEHHLYDGFALAATKDRPTAYMKQPTIDKRIK